MKGEKLQYLAVEIISVAQLTTTTKIQLLNRLSPGDLPDLSHSGLRFWLPWNISTYFLPSLISEAGRQVMLLKTIDLASQISFILSQTHHYSHQHWRDKEGYEYTGNVLTLNLSD